MERSSLKVKSGMHTCKTFSITTKTLVFSFASAVAASVG